MKGTSFVLHNKLGPEDIRQGFSGNYWFLSALPALTRVPAYTTQIFTDSELSPSDAYALHLFKDSESKVVQIDDYFHQQEDQPANAQQGE